MVKSEIKYGCLGFRMNYANAQKSSKQRNKTIAASKPVSIKHADSVKEVLRPKLKIGAPNDKYEQEADRVADQVMRMREPRPNSSLAGLSQENSGNPSAGIIQRVCASCAEDKELVQMKTNGNATPEVTLAISSAIHSMQGGGQSLSRSERNFFEPRFGVDFSGVRVHSDNTAVQMNKEVNSQAFTVGNDIYFDSGRYSSGSGDGKQLLAHELTHVVQQGSKNQNIPNIQRRVRVDPDTAAVNEILGYFGHLCPGSWSNTGQIITGNANSVNNQSCTCVEDVVNDPNRIYTIQVDPVRNIRPPASVYNGILYNGQPEPNLPYPSSGPRTEPGPNPLIHMPPSAGSAIDFGSFNTGGNAVHADNWRILAHELCGHARLNQGYTGGKGDRPEHNSTINTENQIAGEHGGPPRGMYNDRRQGESYHRLGSNPKLAFKLVDGWHYEESTAVQNPPITRGNIQGQVTASTLRIRQGPSTSTPIVGSYPNGTMIDIECQTPGTLVSGNSLWDKVNLGYVSDRYVQTPSPSSTQLPTCDPMPTPTPTTGVIYGRVSTAVSRLRIRQMPSTSSPVVGSYGQGEMVPILCQTNGTNVLGSTIWNHTDRGYISDRYVERLPPNTIVPSC